MRRSRTKTSPLNETNKHSQVWSTETGSNRHSQGCNLVPSHSAICTIGWRSRSRTYEARRQWFYRPRALATCISARIRDPPGALTYERRGGSAVSYHYDPYVRTPGSFSDRATMHVYGTCQGERGRASRLSREQTRECEPLSNAQPDHPLHSL